MVSPPITVKLYLTPIYTLEFLLSFFYDGTELSLPFGVRSCSGSFLLIIYCKRTVIHGLPKLTFSKVEPTRGNF